MYGKSIVLFLFYFKLLLKVEWFASIFFCIAQKIRTHLNNVNWNLFLMCLHLQSLNEQKHFQCLWRLNFLLHIISSCFINQPVWLDFNFWVTNEPRILIFWLITFGFWIPTVFPVTSSGLQTKPIPEQWTLYDLMCFSSLHKETVTTYLLSVLQPEQFFLSLPEILEIAGPLNTQNMICISSITSFSRLSQSSVDPFSVKEDLENLVNIMLGARLTCTLQDLTI